MVIARRPKTTQSNRKLILAMCAAVIFLMGLIFGILAVRSLTGLQRTELAEYLQVFFKGIQGEVSIYRWELVKQSLADNLGKTFLPIWFFGFSIIGAPLVLVVVFIRGFIIGFTVSFLVGELVVPGILMALVAVLPHNIFIIPAIIFAAIGAMDFSLGTLGELFGKRRRGQLGPRLLGSLLGFALSAVLFGIGALVEGYITPFLMEWVARTFM